MSRVAPAAGAAAHNDRATVPALRAGRRRAGQGIGHGPIDVKVLLVEAGAGAAGRVADAWQDATGAAPGLVAVPTLQAAGARLAAEPAPGFDAVLLALPAAAGADLAAVAALKAAGGPVPVIVLGEADDDAVAVGVIRQGAEDYLPTSAVTGPALRRAVQCAIERQRSGGQRATGELFDALTGLPNRHAFTEQLTRATARARRDGRTVALLYLDLDGFKIVNDTQGHEAGDCLLQAVAARLRRSVRTGDVVARLGGDEFAVLIEGPAGPLEVETLAKALLAVVARPCTVAGRPLAVTASLGITLFPGDHGDPQALLANADIAMYQAKAGGRNTFRFFTERMHAELVEYHELERALAGGLARNEFHLAFQPKVDLATRRLQGLEALLRWSNPDRGEVGPATFIPVAEQSGHIVAIGYWVLDQVCRQLAAWRAAGQAVVPVSLNVSARQFQLPDFHRRVAATIRRHGIDPALIEIEITEGLMMEDTGRAERCLEALKAAGVRISVDDFGTGYSCLAYLHRFPIDVLKIDQSFIRQIGQGSGAEGITDAIIALARSLGLETVAEGVETEAQAAFLRDHGCPVGQGFLFGRPMEAAAVAPLLESLPARPATATARNRGRV